MLALIDADIVCYRCAATAENDPDWIAIARTRELIEQIIHETQTNSYKLYLSGTDNFRKKIYPDYKANRTQPPPKHLAVCKEYLVNEWGAEWFNGAEADDALAIEQEKYLRKFDPDSNYWNQPKYNRGSIICSIDKDLKQIPGWHYNFVKKEAEFISTETAIRNFYMQLLTGDPADNIKGCKGIGKAKAPRILEGCETEQEMFEAVRNTYNDDELMLINGQLLWIWREINGIWSPSELAQLTKQEREVSPESTPSTVEGNTLSMELGTK